jgi:hypothetical protein
LSQLTGHFTEEAVDELVCARKLELPPFGGHSIIGHVRPMRRCSHAPHQAGLSAGVQS